MSTGHHLHRISAIAIVLTSLAALAINDVDAGCNNSLYGRPPAYSANYAYVPQTVYMPPVTAVAPPVTTQSAGVIQAQRPAYGALTPVQTFENPSVYTGPVMPLPPAPTVSAQRIPVGTAVTTPPSSGMALVTPMPSTPVQTTYRAPITTAPAPVSQVPISSTLRGNAAINPIVPVAPYTANYPSTVAPVTYGTAPIATAPIATAPVVVQRAPVATTQALPVVQQPKKCCGLSRFFSSCWGRDTSYVTSYYRAPITYYRPTTTVNPVTGTTVTVQQPCSSYVQQLQRVPSTTIQPTTIAPPPSYGSCPSPTVAGPSVPTYSQPAYPSNTYPSSPATIMPPSGIGTVGGQSIPGTPSGVVPIPSTAAPPAAGTPAPLSGSDPQDTQNVPQPRLEAERPSVDDSQANGAFGQTDPSASANSQSTNSQSTNSQSANSQGTAPETTTPAPAASGGQTNESSGNGESAIQLDPPVTRTSPQNAPGNTANPSYATSTPPSLTPPPGLSGSSQFGQPPASQTMSTLRPIGAPAETSRTETGTASQSFTGTAPAAPAPAPVQQPSNSTNHDFNNLPPLPVPSSQNADPSALFRDNETTSAHYRTPAQGSVPVREATNRHGSVRQVANWDTVDKPATTQADLKPLPRRQFGGWIPAK